MQPILRVNVQNQMYYEDLNLMQMFQVSEHSRYLFLEFIKSFSLVVVANQGSYDLHIFRLTNVVSQLDGRQSGCEQNIRMQREYVFKCPRWREKILGVSVIDMARELPKEESSSIHKSCRIYILTSDARIHVLEIKRNSHTHAFSGETVSKRTRVTVNGRSEQRRESRKKHISESILQVNDLIY